MIRLIPCIPKNAFDSNKTPDAAQAVAAAQLSPTSDDIDPAEDYVTVFAKEL